MEKARPVRLEREVGRGEGCLVRQETGKGWTTRALEPMVARSWGKSPSEKTTLATVWRGNGQEARVATDQSPGHSNIQAGVDGSLD